MVAKKLYLRFTSQVITYGRTLASNNGIGKGGGKSLLRSGGKLGLGLVLGGDGPVPEGVELILYLYC